MRASRERSNPRTTVPSDDPKSDDRKNDDRKTDDRKSDDRKSGGSISRRSRSRSPRGRNGGGDGGGKRLKGEAARWNPRGFGFIKPSDGGEDLFCHVSAITDGNVLHEGDMVEYRVLHHTEYDDRKGKYRAIEVTGGVRVCLSEG